MSSQTYFKGTIPSNFRPIIEGYEITLDFSTSLVTEIPQFLSSLVEPAPSEREIDAFTTNFESKGTT